MIVVRRLHLYAGLFLLPWVFLYGVTGAMYNHQWLLPEVTTSELTPEVLSDAPMSEFPQPVELAEQVVAALSAAANDVEITLDTSHPPEFTNDLMYETYIDGQRYVIQIDPVDHSSKLVLHPQNPEQPEKLLTNVRNVTLTPNPLDSATESVGTVLAAAGIEKSGKIKPHGWSKLNFLASVDGVPARITYVLKDGHVETIRYTGEDGMSLRRFMLRLHTTHGQSPHWNGRLLWTFALDAMAIAMVCWGLTGLFMWWQIKRTRRIGGIVLALSLATATWMYLSVHYFYATTQL